LVSIVIATFNHGAYVAAAIESVLAQDHPHVELIVVDDGSTDDTPSVLARYQDRARIIRQANAGQACALNRGWQAARGDILSYLGSDDTLEPNAVSRAAALLRSRPDVALVYCDFLLIDPASHPIRRVSNGEFERSAMVARLICHPGPGAFFRRSGYVEAGPWNESLRQVPDFEFWLRLAHTGTFVRIPEVLARYRVHEGSQSFAQVGAERAEEPAKVMRDYFASLPDGAEELRWRDEGLANGHLLSARLHLRSGRIAEGSQNLRQALRLHPRILLHFRTHRVLANALLNRCAHKLLWLFNRVFRRAKS
jgi:glycosyltransferase involved in cell wall biosynthesis